MKYNPEKHNRRSLRLQEYDYSSAGMYFLTICTYQRQCLLGEIAEGEMRLNEDGQIARSHWLKLPRYHRHLQLEAFVVMPNHIHGILVLTDNNDASLQWIRQYIGNNPLSWQEDQLHPDCSSKG